MAVMKTIKAVMIDLSGTLHINNTVIPGSIPAISRLRKRNIKIQFVTNTTKESKRQLLERLKRLGFDIESHEVFSCLTAAKRFLQDENLRPMLLIDDRAMEDFEGISTENPNCVLVALTPEKFNYETMNAAFRLLLDGASLVAVHKGLYYKRDDGLALGPGPFVRALEFSADKTSTVVGKPDSQFFHGALKELGCHPSEAVMIGDDVRDDILGAQAAGIHGILVKTGKYRKGDEDRYGTKPNVLQDDFSSAVDYLLDKMDS